MAQKVIACFQQTPTPVIFDMQGVEKTAQWVRAIAQEKVAA
ncbi:hypothetical protein [Phormidesmis sp. 146-33]